jgi:hypothetical protein
LDNGFVSERNPYAGGTLVFAVTEPVQTSLAVSAVTVSLASKPDPQATARHNQAYSTFLTVTINTNLNTKFAHNAFIIGHIFSIHRKFLLFLILTNYIN